MVKTRDRVVLGLWMLVVVMFLLAFAPGGQAQDPFLPGDPVEPPRDVVIETFMVAQDTFDNLFVEGGSRGYNVTFERLHGFNVTDSRSVLVVSGVAIVSSGDQGTYEIRLEQGGERIATCQFALQRGELEDPVAVAIYVECGLRDQPVGVPVEQRALRSGNLSVEFVHEGILSKNGSTLSVQLEVYDHVEPEMHDLLQDSTVGVLTAGELIWLLLWFGAFVFAIWWRWWMASGFAIFGAFGSLVPETLAGPEQAAFTIGFFLASCLLHLAHEAWRERKADEEGKSLHSGSQGGA